jgi:hypothetical protein
MVSLCALSCLIESCARSGAWNAQAAASAATAKPALILLIIRTFLVVDLGPAILAGFALAFHTSPKIAQKLQRRPDLRPSPGYFSTLGA